MSRIIVKNLPNRTKEEQLRSLFSQKGPVTDCALKYTKDGVFRKFAFIGYQTQKEAEAAVKHFDQSYINTTKLKVELAKDLTDLSKPRAWSKYSKESSAYQRLRQQEEAAAEKRQKANVDTKNKKKNQKQNVEKQVSAAESMDVSAPVSGEKTAAAVPDQSDRNLSDMEYLRSKVSKKTALFDDDSSSSASDSESMGHHLGNDSDEDSGSSSSSSCGDSSEDEKIEDIKMKGSAAKVDDTIKGPIVKYLVKMRGLPANVKEKQVQDFFKPLTTANIKIPKNAKGKKVFCVATVEFENERMQELAMGRNKNFIGSKRIFLHKLRVEEKMPVTPAAKPWEMKQAGDEEIEPIGESGRLYVRNLAYCCTEEDLEQVFGKFGPLTEVTLPIDSFTKKVKGFAFITYMMPEHAVKAYTELDGTVFMGRMLHLLPGKAKEEETEEATDGTSYKKKKTLQQKAAAGSSHNWNTLFLGSNTVADVIAEKYGTSKQQILDAEQRESLGVRMALGETQVVTETRDFLIEQGVALDAFSQPRAERSKTVILVKNLPASTQAKEMIDLFAKFGTMGRVVLPPSGVTAIVEFMEPTEARAAFKTLAYTKFHHVPLYLEWAPVEVFKAPASATKPHCGTQETDKEVEATSSKTKARGSSGHDDDDGDDDDSEDDVEPGSILFVKNLNFETLEDSLRKAFEKCGPIRNVSIAKKKDLKNIGNMLSLGYGFVEFKKRESAEKALRQLQHTILDEHQLELKVSNRATVQTKATGRKKQDTKKKQRSTKILVRNIPFEAKQKEVQDLFSVFGEIKSVRLPKKLSGTGSHRGFAFVDFLTKQDAKRAFDALCHSTHLYGRRLVLEWADTEETLDQLRHKTAQHFFDEPAKKKMKKSMLIEQLKETE